MVGLVIGLAVTLPLVLTLLVMMASSNRLARRRRS